MRRKMDIGSTERDPNATKEMLDRFAKVIPSTLAVFTLLEDQDQPLPIGHCVRLWREGPALWAEMEIDDGTLWPEKEPHFHAEILAALSKGGDANMLGVIISTMPRGTLQSTIEQALGIPNT